MFKTEVAHSAQIQKIKMNPINLETMITVGFDGIIRMWNSNTMAIGNVIEDKNAKSIKENKYNCAAFSPNYENLVVVGNIVGELKLIDTKKAKVIKTVCISASRQIFDLDWNS